MGSGPAFPLRGQLDMLCQAAFTLHDINHPWEALSQAALVCLEPKAVSHMPKDPLPLISGGGRFRWHLDSFNSLPSRSVSISGGGPVLPPRQAESLEPREAYSLRYHLPLGCKMWQNVAIKDSSKRQPEERNQN